VLAVERSRKAFRYLNVQRAGTISDQNQSSHAYHRDANMFQLTSSPSWPAERAVTSRHRVEVWTHRRGGFLTRFAQAAGSTILQGLSFTLILVLPNLAPPIRAVDFAYDLCGPGGLSLHQSPEICSGSSTDLVSHPAVSEPADSQAVDVANTNVSHASSRRDNARNYDRASPAQSKVDARMACVRELVEDIDGDLSCIADENAPEEVEVVPRIVTLHAHPHVDAKTTPAEENRKVLLTELLQGVGKAGQSAVRCSCGDAGGVGDELVHCVAYQD
jgi:hypothetical protein